MSRYHIQSSDSLIQFKLTYFLKNYFNIILQLLPSLASVINILFAKWPTQYDAKNPALLLFRLDPS
jgi:hypothetical protein